MIAKLIEERFPRARPVDGAGNILPRVLSIAGIQVTASFNSEALIKERDQVVDMLIALSTRLEELDPEAFNQIWHGKQADTGG